MREMQGPKYLTLWKDGRWVFLKREDFECQGFVKKITKWFRKLIRR
ncbi:MAG: hypothetical protein JHC30_06265 [Caldisericum sp.]|nr:hypothetical protein [Caldisericum sp.]